MAAHRVSESRTDIVHRCVVHSHTVSVSDQSICVEQLVSRRSDEDACNALLIGKTPAHGHLVFGR